MLHYGNISSCVACSVSGGVMEVQFRTAFRCTRYGTFT